MHYSFDTYKKEHLRWTWLSGKYTDEQLKEKYFEQYTEFCDSRGLDHDNIVSAESDDVPASRSQIIKDGIRSVAEIDRQIQEEHDHMIQLYAQIHAYETSIEHLNQERKVAEAEELNSYIDNWLNQKFGIKSQKDARNGMYIVFDSEANYIRTVACGRGKEFHYISPADNEGSFAYWLRKYTFYAHSASSFCGRSYTWYQKSFKEQLESLCWEFDEYGKLTKTQW
ncbi:MAG: hypothetical protein ACI4GD_02200 [Lachnospiraceae bacterium]